MTIRFSFSSQATGNVSSAIRTWGRARWSASVTSVTTAPIRDAVWSVGDLESLMRTTVKSAPSRRKTWAPSHTHFNVPLAADTHTHTRDASVHYYCGETFSFHFLDPHHGLIGSDDNENPEALTLLMNVCPLFRSEMAVRRSSIWEVRKQTCFMKGRSTASRRGEEVKVLRRQRRSKKRWRCCASSVCWKLQDVFDLSVNFIFSVTVSILIV